MRFHKRKSVRFTALIIIFYWVWFFSMIDSPLFEQPISTVMEDRNGDLLGAKIAKDGQWRFPEISVVPDKFECALLHFEDQYFYSHPGFNPISLLRASIQNFYSDKVVSGASTITMQTIRLSRKDQARSYSEKIIEIFLSFGITITKSKNKVLKQYCSHAPFGGNVVGIEAASWRYYGRAPNNLSWSESCALAVLPNAPSLIRPGKNVDAFRAKRDKLLHKLLMNNIIDSLTYELSILEPLPGRPQRLPSYSPHLLDYISKLGEGRFVVTLDKDLQRSTNTIINNHINYLEFNYIHNAAAIIIDNRTNEVISYVGNADSKAKNEGRHVDVIRAPRSTGSTLKPLLFASILDEGLYLPESLIEDVPTKISGYAPQNFDNTFDGVVPMSNALTRSLNVPSVLMLQEFGLEKFLNKLNALGLKSINKSSDHYGLTLILGGAESSLWELTSTYKCLAQKLTSDDDGASLSLQPFIFNNSDADETITIPLSQASIWQTFDVLTEVKRPLSEGMWKEFSSTQKIAWKTGTSFGHRDAWAIGVTPEYTVGVWVGNADGEGRPGLTGTSIAAPIMFDIYKTLKNITWFNEPIHETQIIQVCKQSGDRANTHCEDTETVFVPKASLKAKSCQYHKLIHLDAGEQYQVNSSCYPVHEMIEKTWFVLPPIMEWYYKKRNPNYQTLPDWFVECQKDNQNPMQFIYPRFGNKVYIPKDLSGELSKVIFRATHRFTNTEIYWHLDDKYLGTTRAYHAMEFFTKGGYHTMTLVDSDGNELVQRFEVLSK